MIALSNKLFYNVLYLNIQDYMMELTKRMKDLTGQVKGRLTALYPTRKDSQDTVMWKCKCECGNEHEARGVDFTIGKQQSCGCLQTENRFSHNMSNTREYGVWRGIKTRCYESTREHEIKNYQDRGITMCDE